MANLRCGAGGKRRDGGGRRGAAAVVGRPTVVSHHSGSQAYNQLRGPVSVHITDDQVLEDFCRYQCTSWNNIIESRAICLDFFQSIFKSTMQGCGSVLIFCGSGSSSFSQCRARSSYFLKEDPDSSFKKHCTKLPQKEDSVVEKNKSKKQWSLCKFE